MNELISTSELQTEEIKAKLAEDEEKLLNNLKLIKEWIECNSYLPQEYDEKLFITYLRGCKQNLQKAKEKLELYFVTVCTEKEIFADRYLSMESDIRATAAFMYTAALPNLTPEGYRIYVYKLHNPDIEKLNLLCAYRYVCTFLDIVFRENTLMAGQIIIFDALIAGPQHVAKYLTNITWKAISLALSIYPVRVKGVHVVCKVPFIENVLTLLKRVIKDKIIKRFHFHKSYDSLSKYIPETCLPQDYGGVQNSLKDFDELWIAKCLKNKDLHKKIADMKLHGNLPKKMQEYNFDIDYGVQGSFRKLNLD